MKLILKFFIVFFRKIEKSIIIAFYYAYISLVLFLSNYVVRYISPSALKIDSKISVDIVRNVSNATFRIEIQLKHLANIFRIATPRSVCLNTATDMSRATALPLAVKQILISRRCYRWHYLAPFVCARPGGMSSSTSVQWEPLMIPVLILSCRVSHRKKMWSAVQSAIICSINDLPHTFAPPYRSTLISYYACMLHTVERLLMKLIICNKSCVVIFFWKLLTNVFVSSLTDAKF